MSYRNNLRFPGFKRKALTFSFDDGTIDDIKLMELFKKYNVKGTFNLNSGLMNNDPKKINFSDMDKVYQGFEIACHGFTHRSLEEVDIAAGTYDIIKDRENLENKLNRIVKGYAYANGSCGPQSKKILESCGIMYARTVGSTHNFNIPEDFLFLNPTCHYADEEIFNLAKSFVEEKDHYYFTQNMPRLFYIWGHSFEFDMRNDFDKFSKLIEYLSNKEDIYYATNEEIVNYVKAYDMLEYSFDQKIIHNPTALTIYLTIYGKNIEIKPGETVNINNSDLIVNR